MPVRQTGHKTDKQNLYDHKDQDMANKDNTKTVETITHEEARRKNIPTVEFQSVMQKEEENPVRVAYERGRMGLEERC